MLMLLDGHDLPMMDSMLDDATSGVEVDSLRAQSPTTVAQSSSGEASSHTPSELRTPGTATASTGNPTFPVSWSMPDSDVEAWMQTVRPPHDWDPRPEPHPAMQPSDSLGAVLVATKGLPAIRCLGEASFTQAFGARLGDDSGTTACAWRRLDGARIAAIKADVISDMSEASSAEKEIASQALDEFFDAHEPCRRARRLAVEFHQSLRSQCWVW